MGLTEQIKDKKYNKMVEKAAEEGQFFISLDRKEAVNVNADIFTRCINNAILKAMGIKKKYKNYGRQN